MRDLVHNLGVVNALSSAVQAASVKTSAVDTKGYGSVMLTVNTGAIASSGNFTAVLEESDTTTDGDFTTAAAGVTLGSIANPLTADGAFKIGYVGYKRYVRLNFTKNSGTSVAFGVTAILDHPASAPVA
ncbi:hypothetical protein [Mesorhizobium sp. IMUNJ 23232]|uniref:hypothetical protein n=1 Tax=Mesorhizobium sp. IMUNJ 23232 TaxID=3376064 RepID=UPI00378A873C